MSDIFISYANEDRPRAERLAEALRHKGWSVFWDRTIPVGMTWRQVIGQELGDARCVIVLWSRASTESNWVHEEADEGQRRGILIPVLIEDVPPPIGFRSLQAAGLSDWDGTAETPVFRQLISDIARLLGPAPEVAEEKERTRAEAERDAEVMRTTEGEKKYKPEEQAPMRIDTRPAGVPRRWVAIAAGVVILVAAGWGVYQYQAATGLEPGEIFRDCPECPEMIVVPADSFTMGSPEGEAGRDKDEGPQRQVTFSRPFAVGKYEVTFDEWGACVAGGGCGGYRPPDEGWGRGQRPVIDVSWEDASGYVAWLRKETGKPYRLLSEAEWEYVARAGSTSPYPFGNSLTAVCALGNVPDKNTGWGRSYKGCEDDFSNETAPVGRFEANRFGVHDTVGNVWEWVEDCWHADYGDAPNDGAAWGRENGGDCDRRILRGGAWFANPADIRSANRWQARPSVRTNELGYSILGFRVARSLP